MKQTLKASIYEYTWNKSCEIYFMAVNNIYFCYVLEKPLQLNMRILINKL